MGMSRIKTNDILFTTHRLAVLLRLGGSEDAASLHDNQRRHVALAVLEDAHDISVHHVLHLDLIDLHQNVSLLQSLTPGLVHDLLHFLPVSTVRYRETKTHGAFDNVYREQLGSVGT